MLTLKDLSIKGYERVVEITEKAVGLHAFIAIHDLRLGPALGGIRIYPYRSEQEALTDVLRLAKGMTYKSAVAQSGLGGGKSVIMADPKNQKTKQLLYAFGEAINLLEGQYIGAEDLGSTPEDLMVIYEKTPYMCALPTATSSGDPSRFTAWGVFKGIQAVCQTLWNTPSVEGKTIAIQGLGSVGAKLLDHLFWHGAKLIISDINEKKALELGRLYGSTVVSHDKILSTPCDILAPCALGAIINQDSIAKLHCKAIAGAANNQLLSPECGVSLMQKGILYAPDFILNSGGLISAAGEFGLHGYNPIEVRHKVSQLYHTLLLIFKKSTEQHKTPDQIADELAEYNLNNGVGKRVHPIIFKK